MSSLLYASVYFDSVNRTAREISYQYIGEDATKVLAEVLEAVGAELLLAALFCAGFMFFRLTGTQRIAQMAIQGPWTGQKCKSVDSPPVSREGSQNLDRSTSSSLTRRRSAGFQQGPPRNEDNRPARRPSAASPASIRSRASSGAAHESACSEDTAQLLEARSRSRCASDAWSANCEAHLRQQIVAGTSGAAEAFDTMRERGFAPSETALVSLAGLCAESRHVVMAERLLSCARSSHGPVPLALYAAMMKVYSSARLWHKTCGLYEQMRSEGVELDTVVYGCVIKAAVESGRLQLARQLFRESGNPDLLNYMSLIRAAGRERNVPKALSLLEGLERSPMTVDTTAYNCVLEVCAVCGDLPEARQLLRRMESRGHVDVVSYNTYIKALLAGSAHEEVQTVMEEMRSRDLAPNAVTFNSLVKGAVAAKDLERAWRLVGDMEEAGLGPDAFTCSILVKGVKHAPRGEDVDRITDLIRRANVIPDEVLINCLLDTCVRIRDVHRLTQVLDQFKATGVVPSPHAYATLLRAYGHAQRPERVWALWRELVGASGACPHEEAFVSMVEACLASSDVVGAATAFGDVSGNVSQFPRAPAAFAAVVRAAVQSSQVAVVTELYGKVKDLIVCSKVTFNTLIDMLVRQGDMARASELFRDMALNNVEPDLITFSTLIKGHCTSGDIEQGLRLLSLMQRRGIAPDAILFNSILDGCAHKQMRALTEQVLHDMEAAGVAPSNFTLSILVKLYSRCGDLEAAINVVESYPQKYHFKLNAQVYTCLMAACISHGRMATAMQVYNSMTRAGCPSDAKTYQTLLSGSIRYGDLEGAVQLLEDALGRWPPVRPDREVSEGVLLLAQRRGHTCDVALPLLAKMQAAGVNVSERVARSLRRQEAS